VWVRRAGRCMASGDGDLVSSVWGRSSRGGVGPSDHRGRRPSGPGSSYWAE
jgi:hypothetical protein